MMDFELRKIVGIHSTHWNYSKAETLAQLQLYIEQRETEALAEGARRAGLLVLQRGHNEECIFCGRKDAIANDAVAGKLPFIHKVLIGLKGKP